MPLRLADFGERLWAIETDADGIMLRATEGENIPPMLDQAVIAVLRNALDGDVDARLKAESIQAELDDSGRTLANIALSTYPLPD